MYTVKQLAQKLGISAHTVRYYDDKGLFPEVVRDERGARLFSEEQLEWVYLVLCLKRTGMSISDIRRYISLCGEGDRTIRERYGIIMEQKRRAEQELEEMRRKLDVLCAKETYYENLICGAPDAVDSFNPANR